MKYFAYGSNMSIKRITARVPSATIYTLACLKGHALRFHKRSNIDDSAKCDVIASSNADDIVWGVVFDIDDNEKVNLDNVEGLGYGYEVKEIKLTGANGTTLHAFTYYATDIADNLKPYTWYKEHVLRGARENRLPAEYIVLIDKIESKPDPDQDRHNRELSIYR